MLVNCWFQFSFSLTSLELTKTIAAPKAFGGSGAQGKLSFGVATYDGCQHEFGRDLGIQALFESQG